MRNECDIQLNKKAEKVEEGKRSVRGDLRLSKFFVLPILLLIALAAGALDEAIGRVSKVVDSDTFDAVIRERSHWIG